MAAEGKNRERVESLFGVLWRETVSTKQYPGDLLRWDSHWYFLKSHFCGGMGMEPGPG